MGGPQITVSPTGIALAAAQVNVAVVLGATS
jgi:hypothetical protein